MATPTGISDVLRRSLKYLSFDCAPQGCARYLDALHKLDCAPQGYTHCLKALQEEFLCVSQGYTCVVVLVAPPRGICDVLRRPPGYADAFCCIYNLMAPPRYAAPVVRELLEQTGDELR